MIDPTKLLRARKMFSFLANVEEKYVCVEIRCFDDAYYVRVFDANEEPYAPSDVVYSAQSGSVDSSFDQILNEMKTDIDKKIQKQRKELQTAEALLDN